MHRQAGCRQQLLQLRYVDIGRHALVEQDLAAMDEFRLELGGSAQLLEYVYKAVEYSTTTFAEDMSNAGTLTGTTSITLVGDTFTGTNGADWSSLVANVPAGLTAVLTRTSDTTPNGAPVLRHLPIRSR